MFMMVWLASQQNKLFSNIKTFSEMLTFFNWYDIGHEVECPLNTFRIRDVQTDSFHPLCTQIPDFHLSRLGEATCEHVTSERIQTLHE